MRNNFKLPKRIFPLTLGVLFINLAAAQTVSLGLSSATGTPGSAVGLSLSLSATVTQPAALQWTVSYATKDFTALSFSLGTAASAAGKTISCNGGSGVATCVVYGINSNTIANGVVATLNFTLSGTTTDTSSVIQVSGGVGPSLGGSAIPTSVTGGTVTIQQSGPTLTGLSCTPDSVIPPAPSTCVATISSAVSGTSIALGANSSSVVIPSSVTVSSGTMATFQVATSSVTADTKVTITATLGTASANSAVWLVAPSPIGVTPDATVSQSSTGAVSSIASPAFSTTAANELLLAFVGAGPSTSAVTVNSVTGAGVPWVLVQRTNAQAGTAEVWRAFSPVVLSNVTVTANLSASVYSSITVMSFQGIDPSGSSGSGAIGATVSASAASGAPSATLTTTRDGSLVIGVGEDPTSGISRTTAPLQNLVYQDLTTSNNAYWVQTQINTTPSSGTAVSINDLEPTADAYNLTAVEILAPSYCQTALVPTTRSFAVTGGSTTVTVATGSGCSWTATTNAASWISFSGGSGSGNGTFSLIAAPNTTGLAQIGSVSAGGQSFKAMEGGSTQIFGDVAVGSQFYDYITLMYEDGITAGCSTSPLDYCPTTSVTRAEMAVFLVVGLDLATGTTLSYPSTAYFQDVPSSSNYFPFVQRIAQLGITAGCSTSPPDFCPTNTITQEEMAVFMIEAWMQANGLTSFTYTETPYFSDVPASSPYFKFIQKMMDLQFWTGCGSGQYCPTAAVTRADMAPMVMRAIMGAP